MEFSKNIKTEIEINNAIAALYKRQVVNIEGANAALSMMIDAPSREPGKYKKTLALLERAIEKDQHQFMASIEDLANKYGKDRVSRIMRTGIDLTGHNAH